MVVGYSPKLEGEGFDRKSMDLPAGQDDLIAAVADANKNTIVVVAAGAPVTMTRWISRVPAVVYAWYGGQETGYAIGDVLFGAVNPSGKLPVTFPKAFCGFGGVWPLSRRESACGARGGHVRRLPRIRQTRRRAGLSIRSRHVVHDVRVEPAPDFARQDRGGPDRQRERERAE